MKPFPIITVLLVSLTIRPTAPAAPSLSIQPAVQINFDTTTNRFYMVETASELTPTQWTPAGPTHWGRGLPITQSIPASSAQSFFRTREFDLTNQLYAHFSLDGILPTDHTGPKIHADHFMPDRFGVPNHACRNLGDSSDPYGMFASTVLYAQSTNDFTVSLWVLGNFSTPSPTNFGRILSFDFGFILLGTNNTLQLRLPNRTNAVVTSPPITWENNRWYNIQLVRSQSIFSIYRDLQPMGQSDITTFAPGRDYFSVYLGPKQGGADNLFLYNRALTIDELTLLHHLAEH